MGSNEAIYGLVTSQVVVAPGATNAVYVDQIPRQGSGLVKYFSGGTLEIHGANPLTGMTLSGASLVPLQGTGYVFGTAEALTLDGPARFYLMATGATAVAHLLRGITAPGFNGVNGE